MDTVDLELHVVIEKHAGMDSYLKQSTASSRQLTQKSKGMRAQNMPLLQFNNAWTLAKIPQSYILPSILNKHKNEQHFSYKHSFQFIRDANAIGKAITFYKNQRQKSIFRMWDSTRNS